MIEFEKEYDVKKLSFRQKPVVEFGRDEHLIEMLSKKSQMLYEKSPIKTEEEQPVVEESIAESQTDSQLVFSQHTQQLQEQQTQEDSFSTESSYTYVSDDDLPEALHNVTKRNSQVLQQSKHELRMQKDIESFELPTEIPTLIESNVVELTPINLADYEKKSAFPKVLFALFCVLCYIGMVYACFLYVKDDALRMIVVVSLSMCCVVGMMIWSMLRTSRRFTSIS